MSPPAPFVRCEVTTSLSVHLFTLANPIRPSSGVLPNGYNPPEGFCWDQSCSDPPIQDDPNLEDYNVDEIVQRFLKAANDQV